VNLSVSSPQGGICATADALWGAMERPSRDEQADVRPNCADTVSTNARASYENEALHAMAKYALEELSNTVLAAEYRSLFLTTALLAQEIAQTRRQLNLQRQNAFRALPRRRRVGALGTPRSRRAWQGHHLIAEGGRRLGGASQITAGAEPLSLHRWISRSLPPNSAAAHAIHVPGGSRMFRFVVPGDLLFQFIVRKVRRESGTSGTGPLTDQSVTRRAVHRFHVPERVHSGNHVV
jgi:hypothetical protein